MPHHTTKPERERRAEVHTRLQTTLGLARSTLTQAASAGDLRAKATELKEMHPEFAEAELGDRVRWVLILIALGVAIPLDAILVAPVGEYVSIAYLSLAPDTARIVGYVFPGLFILAELGIGQARISEALSPTARAVFTVVAVVMTITVPLLVARTAMASMDATGVAGNEALVWGMAALSAAIHGFVLFGGAAHVVAISWGYWSRKTTALNRQATAAERRAAVDGESACDNLAAWATARDQFARDYPQAPPLGQPYFGPEVAALINERYGYDVVQRPNNTTEHTGPAPTPNINDAANRRAREADRVIVND